MLKAKRLNGHYSKVRSAVKLVARQPELSYSPAYRTSLGAAYVANSRDLLAALPNESANLVVTSPPYALHFKKEYGNVEKQNYVSWFLPFAREIFRILKADGSFILNIGGSFNQGKPTRSLYHFKLLVALVEELGFHLAQVNGHSSFDSMRDRIRKAQWYVLSARKADKLLREFLFERVFALRTRNFSRQFRGAELDMHFSLSKDMTPLSKYLETLRESGYPRVTTLLERGDF